MSNLIRKFILTLLLCFVLWNSCLADGIVTDNLDFGNFLEKTKTRIYGNLEVAELQGKGAFYLDFAPDGTVSNIRVMHSTNSSQADFACQQAIAESSKLLESPDKRQQRTMEIVFKNCERTNFENCIEKFKTSHHLKDSQIVMHLIPLDVLQAYPNIPAPAIHCAKNLRVLKPGAETSAELLAFRNEWTNFIRSHQVMDLQLLQAQKAHLEQSCGNLFE